MIKVCLGVILISEISFGLAESNNGSDLFYGALEIGVHFVVGEA
jgi:hypothetical protein